MRAKKLTLSDAVEKLSFIKEGITEQDVLELIDKSKSVKKKYDKNKEVYISESDIDGLYMMLGVLS